MSDRFDFEFDSMRGVSVPRSLISLPDFPIPGMEMSGARSTISSARHAPSVSGMSVDTTRGRYLEVSRRTSQATSIAASEVYSAFVETGPAFSVMTEAPPSEGSSYTPFKRKIPIMKNQPPNVSIRNINLNPPDTTPYPSSELVPYQSALATYSNLTPVVEEHRFDYQKPQPQHAIVERSSSLPRMRPGQLPLATTNYVLPSKQAVPSERLYIPDYRSNPGRPERPPNRQPNITRRSSSQKVTGHRTKAIQELAPPPRSKEGMVRRAFYRKQSSANDQSIIATKKDFKHRPEFYVPPPTAKRKPPPSTKRKFNNTLIDEYSPPAYKSNIMRPHPSQQSRALPVFGQLTPVASRSLLTCNNDFRQCYPQVYQGICKGVIDVDRLIVNEVVIPIREEVAIHKSALRSRRAVVSIVSEQLWKPLHGKFPDPQIAPRLVKRVAEYFHDKIEAGVEDAEDERSLFQWLFRFDIENAIEIKVTTSLAYGVNSVIANIEGTAHIKRKKGEIMGLWSKDNLLIDLEVIVKAVFLNGGQLSEIDSDPMFADRVQCGGNRMLGQFLTE